jgi:tetratricopeptide (TPR) repeat protein/peroxiredoxin/tRNA A-37 threonylcarbamoyl transferase component Bud32
MSDQPSMTLPPDQPASDEAATEAVSRVQPAVTRQDQTAAVDEVKRTDSTLCDDPNAKNNTPAGGIENAPTLTTDGDAPQRVDHTMSEAPASAPMPCSGQLGDYELIKEIARGGMGVVYKARQKSLNRVVALKMILAGQLASREQVRRFRVEAEEAGKLHHPNIVPIYQVCEEQGQHYFTMKLIDGSSLTAQVHRFAEDPKAACRLVATVARAVQYAHQRGTLHRDLKPGNILIDEHGQPHVTDFGLAKHLGGGTGGTHDTQSGAILGTPSYMAPEQAAASKDLSVAVDVYSLGVILYELLTGRTPFKAESTFETLMHVMERDPTPVRAINPEIDRDLETICLHCLEKDPAKRYRSAARLADDLDHYLAGEPIEARPVGTVERSVKWMRRRPAAAALCGISAMAALGLGLLGWFDSFRLDAAWREATNNAQIAEKNAADAKANADRAEVNAREALKQKQAADDNAAAAKLNAEAAEANAKEAIDQREQVTAAFRKRQDTVDALLVRIDRRLENYGSGLASVRLEFLDEFRRLNEELLRERGQDPVVRRQAAQLYQRIGDLAILGSGPNGPEAYAKAIEFFKGLAEQDPKNQEDRLMLAHTHSQLAQLQRRMRQYKEAEKSYTEAIRLREKLIAEFPTNPVHRYRTAHYRFLLGDLLDQQNRVKDAEPLYRRARAELEQLIKEHPAEASYRGSLLDVAGSLAMAIESSRPDESTQLFEQIAHAYWENAKTDQRYLQLVVSSGYEWCEHLQRRVRHADMARLAVDITTEFSTSSDVHYHAACFASRAANTVAKDKQVATADQDKLAARYAQQAVELLRRAIQLGWKDRQHMFIDRDLDPLRPRTDFRALMVDLDKRIGKTLTTAELVNYLRDRVQQEQDGYQSTLRSARTVAQRKKAIYNRPQLEDFTHRLLALAVENPKEPTVVTALGELLVLTAKPELARSKTAKQQRAEAFRLLERDHLQTPAIIDVFDSLGSAPTPEGDRLLKTAFTKHALPDVRGQAGFWLAYSLAAQAQPQNGAPPKNAEELFKQAEAYYEQVARDYGSLAHGTATLGDAAKSQLHALRHLAIGRPAADIVGNDLNGQPMKLSEFHGKVVMLDFWANWCGWCRQMYPDEREMVKRLKQRPFVLVGVNGDSGDPQELEKEIKRHGITWRSWSNSDRNLSTLWQAESLPTIYLIDHKGIIRHHYRGYVRGPEINAAVDRLLAECEKDSKK